MSVAYMVITIVLMVVVQFIIGFLWYSKFLFGKLFMSLSGINFENLDPNAMKASYIKAIVTAAIKAIIIYLLSQDIYILQSFYSFSFILLIAFLVIIEMSDEHIWGGKSFKLYLLNASQSFVTIIACFFVAFFSYYLFP